MRNTTCPTCGGPAFYPSANFQHAEVMISAIKKELDIYMKNAREVAEVLATKAETPENMNSSQLFELLIVKLQQEFNQDQLSRINIGKLFLRDYVEESSPNNWKGLK